MRCAAESDTYRRSARRRRPSRPGATACPSPANRPQEPALAVEHEHLPQRAVGEKNRLVRPERHRDRRCEALLTRGGSIFTSRGFAGIEDDERLRARIRDIELVPRARRRSSGRTKRNGTSPVTLSMKRCIGPRSSPQSAGVAMLRTKRMRACAGGFGHTSACRGTAVAPDAHRRIAARGSSSARTRAAEQQPRTDGTSLSEFGRESNVHRGGSQNRRTMPTCTIAFNESTLAALAILHRRRRN